VPTFTLDTAFTEQDLQRFLASGSNVVVAKPTGGGSPNVAWVVYRPLLANTMTWEESYGIYASNTEIVNGALLTQMSQTPYPAVADATYSLNPAGFFGPPASGGVPNSYSAENEYDNLPKGYLTMGLYQDASVNGVPVHGNAVSAAPVIYQSTAVMTPFTTVYLWIQSSVVSNTVVTTVTSPMTKVKFGGSVTDVALQYDASSGIFLPAGGDEVVGAGIGIDHLIPALI
jgi:hypothetical protein